MIRPLAILFVCQLAGESAARGIGLALPGPVIGLILLAAGLMLAARFGGPAPETVGETALGRTTAGLLGILGILFVPAGVGVVQELPLLQQHGIALMAALLGSTAITLVALLTAKFNAEVRSPETVPRHGVRCGAVTPNRLAMNWLIEVWSNTCEQT